MCSPPPPINLQPKTARLNGEAQALQPGEVAAELSMGLSALTLDLPQGEESCLEPEG